MSVSDDEQALQGLEQELAAIQGNPHNGYTDASRFTRVKSEIDALQRQIARQRQHAEQGEG
jgi:hypothetical protein